MKKKLVLCLSIATLAIQALVLPVMATPVSAAVSSETTVEPRVKPVKKWVYKEINGKWYRRLFNVTTGEYETDWIPV